MNRARYSMVPLKIVQVVTVIGVALVIFSCSSSGPGSEPGNSRQQILMSRARAVLGAIPGEESETPANLIRASQLYAWLQDPAVMQRIIMIDTRSSREWSREGHIRGAVPMKFQEIAAPENLARLDRDQRIVCLSSTGHTAVQAASVFRWLGYDAVLLEHGMAGWMPSNARGMMVVDVENGMARRYPVVMESGQQKKSAGSAAGELAPPSAEEFETLAEAARELMQANVFKKKYPFNHIFADDLYTRLQDPAAAQKIFLLDIRSQNDWQAIGHIKGAVHIPWLELGVAGTLEKLPRDKLIVVICNTGQTAGQVTPILRMVGYDAVTLRSGMTAWTETPHSRESLDLLKGRPEYLEMVVKGM